MTILERTPDVLKLTESQLSAKSFLVAGIFLSIPQIAGLFLFHSVAAVAVTVAGLLVLWAVIGGVWAFARRRFRNNTMCTFDRRSGSLTIERWGKPAEVYALAAISDIDTEMGVRGAYRTLLRLGPGQTVALTDAYLDVRTFLDDQRAVLEFLGLTERQPEEVSSAATAATYGARGRVVTCGYCQRVANDLAPVSLLGIRPDGVNDTVRVERCARCARLHHWCEVIGPGIGLFGVVIASGVVFFLFVADEAKGPLWNVLLAFPFTILAFLVGAGVFLLARAILDPRRWGSRRYEDWTDFPQILDLRANGWEVKEQPSVGFDTSAT